MINYCNTIKELIEQNKCSAFRTSNGQYYFRMNEEERTTMFALSSKELRLFLKSFFLQKYDEMPNDGQISDIISYLEAIAYRNLIDHKSYKRIYNDGKKYMYDLNKDKSTVISISKGRCKLVKISSNYFMRTSMFVNQVEPDFSVNPECLPELVEKHFHFPSDNETILFSIYLVTCFWGLNINHPILAIYGQKGASKSTTLRRLEQIVDPKCIDLCGMPKNADDLALRLSNSYMAVFDNLPTLRRNTSDNLARAVTGGTFTKRALYENTAEIALDIHSVIAINGVDLSVKESDLLDRALLLELRRLKPEELRTEQELKEAFEEDLPQILGCCFQLLAKAMYDDEPIQITQKTRMVDFFEAAIRVGRALGYEDDDISYLLWNNQSNINKEVLDNNLVAQCIIELMKNRKSYKCSMTELLGDIQDIAVANNVNISMLPKLPNQLSRRLNSIKSNLSQECGIDYTIVNVGTFKEIRINKK